MELRTIGGVAPDRVPDPTQIAAERETRKKAVRQAAPGIIAIVISLAAAAFTAWQAYESHQARIDAREAAKVARQDAKDAAALARADSQAAIQRQLDAAKASQEQAERSAKAAEASASIAAQSLHISERAYVDVAISLKKPLTVGEEIAIKFIAKNTGRTPAVKLHGRSGMALDLIPFSDEQARPRALGDTARRASPSEVTLGSGSQVEAYPSNGKPLTQEMFDSINQNKALLYAFALVDYRDIFNRQHQIEVCGVYNPTLSSFDVCPRNNNSY